MPGLETLRIVNPKDPARMLVINASDLDPERHVLRLERGSPPDPESMNRAQILEYAENALGLRLDRRQGIARLRRLLAQALAESPDTTHAPIPAPALFDPHQEA
jgi:hypothetical protein